MPTYTVQLVGVLHAVNLKAILYLDCRMWSGRVVRDPPTGNAPQFKDSTQSWKCLNLFLSGKDYCLTAVLPTLKTSIDWVTFPKPK